MAKTQGLLVKVLLGTGRAAGTLTISGDGADPETVTIGGVIYEWDTDATPTVTAGNVRVDVSAGAGKAAAQAALIIAINNYDGSLVVASAGGGDDMTVTAKEYGTGGNAIATTELGANTSWAAGTLGSGADAVVALQRGGSLTINGETVDTTTKSDTIWRTILPTWNDTEVQCSGLADINGTGHELLVTQEIGQAPVTLHIALNAGATRYFTGRFYCTKLDPVSSAAHDGVAEFSGTFKCDGALSYVDA
jgi:hypothetical protein